jgi:diguanylate cyclase (GGDEF)-like protein
MEKEKQLVLVAEDQAVNREILKTILQSEYQVIETENGAAALAELERHKDIAAILLDIVMPVMNGYEVLERLRNSPFSSIPTIVMTGETDKSSEQKALDLGAWDFVSKPYQPATLRTRLKNVIVRSQFYLLSEMKQLYERDPLTGLYNRAHFFDETRKLLTQNPGISFALVRMDIDHFQSYNTFWGEEEGDTLLRFLAEKLEKALQTERPHTYARINADVFCFCVPYHAERIQQLADNAYQQLAVYNPEYRLVPSFGVYVIENSADSIQRMYERVTLAAKTCKGSYLTYLSYYRPEMSQSIMQNQWVVNEMQHALDTRQFEVYLQPKYNLKTERPCGAEALIRWHHPEKGMLSPGTFIPVFEQNGFIGKVDYYVWESVCQLLRRWLDLGAEPAPVSVNVSRANMYNSNLVHSLIQLAAQYRIPPRLLELEVTESAYMENPSAMEKIISDLHEAGFTILMDDFGSGYSSLNTLKDIHVDILKVDMKFLSGDSEESRGRSILASTIRMAGWLNTPVIMEGVETAEQVSFLKSIGCNYAQGYYYARPMPVKEYEKLTAKCTPADTAPRTENSEAIAEILWSSASGCELLLDSMDTPAAVYLVEDNCIQILRVNTSFYEQYVSRYQIGQAMDFSVKKCMSPDSIRTLRCAFLQIAKDRKQACCRFSIRGFDGEEKTLCASLRYWGVSGTASIIFVQYSIEPRSGQASNSTEEPLDNELA